ncbi:MAG: M15 family metallopeptidase [Methylobacteriaceae bacterium]|nr:M15 family metallopeptidase [Methylobacteriaceae bacterium]
MRRRPISPSHLALRNLVLALCVAAAALPARADSVTPISPALCAEMKAHRVMRADAPVGCERLALVRFTYIGFDGREHADGELVVLDALADQVARIFAALRARRFPLQQARLMNAYDGDDDASMDANNTSAFNDRNVVGTQSISMHAYGAAIDINPVQNPAYDRVNGMRVLVPQAGAAYAQRSPLRSGMAESVTQVFAAHGFTVWGGRFRDPDYQHFTIPRALSQKLIRLPPREARAMFDAAAGHGAKK